MAIDAIMRGLLEQYIDSIVIAIPNIVKVFFDPSKKAQLQIQNENDFALGIALGNIQNAFLTTFVSTQATYPNAEELTDISNVIFKRIPELRDAIVKIRQISFVHISASKCTFLKYSIKTISIRHIVLISLR
jgi:hypothetical protein